MKLTKIMAAVMAAGMMAGCAVSAPGYEAGAEPVVTVPQVAVTEPAPTQKRGWEFGDIVYSLETWPDGTVSVSRHAVVAHVDDIVMVTSAISDSAEALRKCLPEAMESWAEVPLGDCIEQFEADMLYSSERAEQEAADELMSGR